jgi:hypothetical protein
MVAIKPQLPTRSTQLGAMACCMLCSATQRVPHILQTCRRRPHAWPICCVTSFVGKAGFSRSGGSVQSHADMPKSVGWHDVSSSSPPLRLQTLLSSGTCLKDWRDWLANRDHHGFCKLSIVSPNVHDIHASWRSTGPRAHGRSMGLLWSSVFVFMPRGLNFYLRRHAIFDATISRVTLPWPFTWQAQRTRG